MVDKNDEHIFCQELSCLFRSSPSHTTVNSAKEAYVILLSQLDFTFLCMLLASIEKMLMSLWCCSEVHGSIMNLGTWH